MSDFIYSVEATLSCTHVEAGVILDFVDAGFQIHAGRPTAFVDPNGSFTEAGVEAMLTGFTAGVTGIIHTAGQRSGMDTAVLLRRAISMMEEQFVQQVEASPVVLVARPKLTDTDGTQPEEVP